MPLDRLARAGESLIAGTVEMKALPTESMLDFLAPDPT